MDPLTMLSLAAGAKSLFSKKAKQPQYQQQEFGGQYQPTQMGRLPRAPRLGALPNAPTLGALPNAPTLGALPNAPDYQQDGQGQETGNALFQTVIGKQLANYNAGRPILDEPYRNAVLGQAKRSFDLSANESGNQVNEQYNNLNLLGATGHGQALGEVQRSRLQGLGNIEDQLTQAELGQLNNATNQGLSLQGAFAQRENQRNAFNMQGAEFNRGNATTAFGAGLQGAEFNRGNATTAFGAGLQGAEFNRGNATTAFGAGLQGAEFNRGNATTTANFNQSERQNAFQNALAGYGANQRERQTAFQGAQGAADTQTGLGLGLLKLGVDAYTNRRPVGNAALVGQMNQVAGAGSRAARGASSTLSRWRGA